MVAAAKAVLLLLLLVVFVTVLREKHEKIRLLLLLRRPRFGFVVVPRCCSCFMKASISRMSPEVILYVFFDLPVTARSLGTVFLLSFQAPLKLKPPLGNQARLSQGKSKSKRRTRKSPNVIKVRIIHHRLLVVVLGRGRRRRSRHCYLRG